MNTHTTLGRRLVAVLGAAAIGLIGLAGAAHAEDTEGAIPGNIDSSKTGSLTLHKFEETGTTDEYNPDGSSLSNGRTPLLNVGFTLYKIDSDDIDLTTNVGWDKTNALASDLTVSEDGKTVTDGENNTYDLTQSGDEQFTVQDGSTEWTGLELAAYVVVETTPPDNATNHTAPFVVTIPLPHDDEWLYSVNVYPKNSTSNSTKTVESSGLGLGSPVTYTITVPIPTLAKGASFTKFQISDALPEGFAYDSASVTPTDAPVVPSYDSVKNTVTFGPGPVATSDTWDRWLKENQGKDVVLTIKGKVTNVGEIENTANVTVNDLTQEPTATTQWGAINITKTDAADSSTKLSGAQFQIFETAAEAITGGNPISVNNENTFTTGTGVDLGKVTIDGLWISDDSTTASNEYFVKEIKAPAGYEIPEGNVTDPSNPGAKLTGVWRVTVSSEGAASVELTVADPQVPRVELPLTGANGELLMTVGGLALLLLAGGGALVVRSRRHQS